MSKTIKPEEKETKVSNVKEESKKDKKEDSNEKEATPELTPAQVIARNQGRKF